MHAIRVIIAHGLTKFMRTYACYHVGTLLPSGPNGKAGRLSMQLKYTDPNAGSGGGGGGASAGGDASTSGDGGGQESAAATEVILTYLHSRYFVL